jgi:signal transduction histidine kinase/CheY-like chemotaxis protein
MTSRQPVSMSGAPVAELADQLPLPSRDFAATRKILYILLAISVIVPALCVGGYGYYDYQRRYQDAITGSDRTARIAEEQALKVMDLNAELVSRVCDLLGDRNDNQIQAAQDEIHHKLNAIAGDVPQVAAISAFGESGDLLASSRFFPVPRLNIGRRDDFLLTRRYQPEAYISLPIPAGISGIGVFNIAKARVAADGSFLGTVSIALKRDYLSAFYERLTQEEDDDAFIGLYRRDGALLASFPPSGMTSPELTSQSLTAGFARNEAAGHVNTARFADHQRRFATYRRVGAYRLYVAAGFPVGQIFYGWLRHFLFIAALVSVPCAAIWALLGFSLRQVSTEERAWLEWRGETVRRLKVEASGRHLQRMGALGNLVANVAHEFNNHLMAVKSNLDLATRKGFRDVGAEIRAVARTTSSVEALVRTLMGATRKHPLKTTHVDPASTLVGLHPIVRAAVGDAVAVSIDLAPDIWSIRCDPSELELAIINLALNARDAMPRGGRFMIRAQNVQAESEVVGVMAGDYVLVSASDEGEGMPPEVADRAFEPLFTTKSNSTAVGLGLTQVLTFCELSGGTAKITSSPHMGTTVRMYLPRSAASTQPAGDTVRQAPAPTEAVVGPVLLVEDNHEVAAGLTAVLEMMGHDVIHMESADDALEALLAGERYRIVLSDVQMPGKMNGIDLVEWMKTNRPRQTVALMTGYADELERARSTGVPIFAKPFDAEELTALMS